MILKIYTDHGIIGLGEPIVEGRADFPIFFQTNFLLILFIIFQFAVGLLVYHTLQSS